MSALREPSAMREPSPIRELSQVQATDFPERWYDAMDAGHFLMDWRMRAFAAQLRALRLPRDAPWRGLDVGCGHGVLRAQMEAETAWTVDGADVDRAALARSRPGRGEALLYDVRERRPELCARYDFALLFDVLEHLAAPREILAAVADHLAPGGWLFVNVPALPRLASTFDRVVGHLRRYTPRTLRGELEGLPFAVRDVRYWGLPMVPFLFYRKLAAPPEAQAERVIDQGLGSGVRGVRRLDGVIRWLARVEAAALPRPPLGTSLLLAARREAAA